MVSITMIEIAVITQQVYALTCGTFGFFAGCWSRLFMLNYRDISCWAGYWKAGVEDIQGQQSKSPWFEIDLGISLFNYGVGLDWDGVMEERPSFMQTGAFKPCDCKKCFFCLQGHMNGITHCPWKQAKVTVEYKCGMRARTNNCANVRLSLELESGWYCGMCYRKQLTNELSAKERKKACISSQMGCPICKEPICKECRKEGYYELA